MKHSAEVTPIVQPVLIVTGCGSGIGFELAKILHASPQFRVVITARQHHMARLRAEFPESVRFKVAPLDITVDEDIYHLVHQTCRTWGRIDAIINNAAVCYRSVVEHMDSDAELEQMKTNYLGPMCLIRAVLPIMREQRSGRIINLTSASGILAMPTMASYSASKRALEGATEALWYEVRSMGIRPHLVEIGFVNSMSFKKVILSKKAKLTMMVDGPFAEYYDSMAPFIENLMGHSASSSKKIAQKIYRVLNSNQDALWIRATQDIYLYSLLKWLTPREFLHRFLYFMLPGSMRWGGAWRQSERPRQIKST